MDVKLCHTGFRTPGLTISGISSFHLNASLPTPEKNDDNRDPALLYLERSRYIRLLLPVAQQSRHQH